MKKRNIMLAVLAAVPMLVSAAPLTLPADFTSDLVTTAATFAAGALVIWSAIAIGKLGLAAFRKFYG